MGMTVFGVVFAVALFLCLAVLQHFTRKRVIHKPLQEARARHSPVAEFVDDLMRYRWIVIIGLAILVAVDKSFGFSGGLLQSKLAIGLLITAIFAWRLLARRSAGPSRNT